MRKRFALLLKILIVFLIIFISAFQVSYAQRIIRGSVLDNVTSKKISGATILDHFAKPIFSTDKNGEFIIKVDSTLKYLTIKAMGYAESKVLLAKGTTDTSFHVLLEASNNQIEEVQVTKNGKYKNNNPATELIDLVIRNKGKNRLERKDSLYFEQYDKIKFGMINPPPRLRTGMGNIGSFFGNTDKTMFPNKETVTLFMQEELSDNFIKQNPSRAKRIIKSQEKTEFDPKYVNNPNIQTYMQFLFKEVDIYDESLFFLNKLFLSPIADNAKIFYKYYVVDTVKSANDLYVKLRFEPRNTTDLLFKGDLLISLDGNYAVKGANLKVDDNANINWVNDVAINLSYFKDISGVMLKDTTHVLIAFGARSDAVFGERLSLNQKYNLAYPIHPNTFDGAPIELATSNNVLLNQARPIALNPAEELTYSNVDALNNMASFKAMMITGYLLSQGYYSLGKFELGPLEYLYHKNNYEGNRFRIGGRTTSLFSEKMYLEGYVAYGTDDQDFKYYGRGAFSINGKPVTNFPAHYLEASIQKDIFEPGKAIGYLKGDSFFRSFISNKPTKWLNTEAYKLGHVIEFGNHVSIATHFTHQRRNPIGDMKFISSADALTELSAMNTNDLQFVLRWAPSEKFFYRNMTRKTTKDKYPVFNLQYNRGFKGFWDANYTYDALRFSASKRFFMNQLGFGDATFTVGKIWGTLPYPLLEMPNIQEQKDRHSISYDMTNSMEFAADQFIKFEYDHELNGFLFNKIPFLKKLKWRETFGARMFYGKLSDHNNPYLSDDVILFDRHKDGYVMTNVLTDKPYWEGVVGIDNIFKVFKLEYYKRLSYLNLPDVNDGRFKMSFHLNF